jgi:hypothetical protein
VVTYTVHICIGWPPSLISAPLLFTIHNKNMCLFLS